MERTIDELRNKWKDVEIDVIVGLDKHNELHGVTMRYKFKDNYILVYFSYDDLSDNIYNDIEKPILEYKIKLRKNKLERIING